MSFLSSLFGRGDPNAPLVELMARLAAEATPALEGEFYNRLQGARLRVASPSLESQGLPVGTLTAVADTEVRLVATTDPAGRRAALAFTSDRALRLWRPVGCDTVELEFPELCRLALSAGVEAVLIDSGSPHCSLVPEAELTEFAAGRVPLAAGLCRAESAAGLVLSALPSPPPEALCAALRAEAAEHAPIAKVYLVSAAEGAGPPYPVVALELADGADPALVVPPFASGAVVRLGGRPIPDVLPLVGDPALSDAARAHGTLVYTSAAPA